MKSFVILFIFLINSAIANAQFGKEHAIYVSSDLSFGMYFGIDLNLNYMYKETYSLRLGLSGFVRDSKTTPKDYNPGLELLPFTGPIDQLVNYQLCVGKIKLLNPKGTIRLNQFVGLAYTLISEPDNYVKGSSGFFSDNYDWEFEKHHVLSLLINPKFEFAFTRYFGLSISPILLINKDRVNIGVGAGTMFGLLRKRKKQRKSIRNKTEYL
ncbi:MAG: hypothetical protein ACPG4W_07775 [Flavobacteriales bacterium]